MQIERIWLDDDLVAEVEARAPDGASWSTLISDSLRYALDLADAEHRDVETGDETDQ